MTNPSIRVALGGQQLVLTAATLNGVSVTLYSDSGSSQAVTLPAAVSEDTTYYLPANSRGYCTVSFRELDGTPLAAEGGIVQTNLVTNITPGPSPAQLVANASRARADLDHWLNGGLAVCRSNLRRQDCMSNTAALTTQVMTSVAVLLEKGDVITSITFVSATTAADTPTNWWFALYSPAGALLGQTEDQTSTAWGSNTVKTVALADPYTVTETGIHYAGVMVKATTPPSLAGVTLHNAVESGPIITGQKRLSQTSGSSLTATAPETIATPTAIAAVPLVILT